MEYEFNLFEAAKYDKIEYECFCGHINNITISRDNKKRYMNKYYSYDDIYYELNMHTMLKDDSIFHDFDDSRMFFLGDKNIVRKKLVDMGIDTTHVAKKIKKDKNFDNFTMLTKALIKLYDLDKNNNIVCDCGNTNIKIELYSNRLELKCPNCNSVKFVYVETDEDLDILLKKDRLYIEDDKVLFIDSIVGKSDHVKK